MTAVLVDRVRAAGEARVREVARRGQFDLYQWRKGAWEDWNLTPCRRRPWEDET